MQKFRFCVVFPKCYSLTVEEFDEHYQVDQDDPEYVCVFAWRLTSPVFEGRQIEPSHMTGLESLNPGMIKALTDYYERLVAECDARGLDKKSITCGWTVQLLFETDDDTI